MWIFLLLFIVILIAGWFFFFYRREPVSTNSISSPSTSSLEQNVSHQLPETNNLLPSPDDPNFPEITKIPPKQRGYGPDCYLFPGSCPNGTWCQLEDRPQWWIKENVTRGRCVTYQKECYSCT